MKQALAHWQHTSPEFPGSVSPSLPARSMVSLLPGQALGQVEAMALAQFSWGRHCIAATSGEGGLTGGRVQAGKTWGTDNVGTEAELRLPLMGKGPIPMKRSTANGSRVGQSSGVVENTPPDQGTEQVPLSSKKHLLWWQCWVDNRLRFFFPVGG